MPLQTSSANIQYPQRSKPGPKPKPLQERKYKPRTKPVQSAHRFYTKEHKIEVLKFLLHHQVATTTTTTYQKPRHRSGIPESTNPAYRPVTLKEASTFWKIPRTTIQRWWEQRDQVLAGKTSIYLPHWPELEHELYTQILAHRKAGKLATVGWIRRISRKIFQAQNPHCNSIFTFSHGWFQGFLKRYYLSRRRLTKQASKLPSEYIQLSNNFLQFIRRNSQINMITEPPTQHYSSYFDTILNISPPRRFPKARILNMDETPIPFEYLDGYTYEIKGSKTVSGHTDRSGWNKRQATLILYIFADGIQRIKPKLIFHGVSGPTNRILKQESHLYSPDVTVEFNSTAYNNEGLFKQWIEEELAPITNQKDTMLVMDVASFHKTPEILDHLKSINILPTLIPPGCTSILQPLDTAVNKPFKQWLQEATDQYIEAIEANQPNFKWTTSNKCIMTTFIVTTAAKHFQEEKKELVQRAFIQCKISIRPDGSEDSQIKFKGIPNDAIDYTGWQSINYDVEAIQTELLRKIPTEIDKIEEIVLYGE